MTSTESPAPEALLLELERLDKAATPGPWEVEDFGGWWRVKHEGAVCFDDGSACDEYNQECSEENRDLLVALRNSLPAILAHLRELASLKSRGVTMSQEHLDTLLRQEREKALNEAEAAVRAVEKEEADNMYQAYCDIAHNTATRCADAVAGVPK